MRNACSGRLPSLRDAVLTFALLALANLAVTFLLVPGNPVVLFPVHHDDYTDLALRLSDLSLRTPRPLAMAAIALLAWFGPAVYSVGLQVLLVLFPTLVLILLSALFGQRSRGGTIVLYGLALYSCPNAIEWGKVTGLVTNGLAATFAGLAMLAMLAAALGVRPRLLRGLAMLSLAASLLSKEDHALAVLTLAAFLALRSPQAGGRKRAALTLLGVVGLLALYVLHDRVVVHSPFTSAAGGPYQVVLTAGSLLHTTAQYLLATRYRLMVFVLFAASAAAGSMLLPARRPAILLVAAVTGALVAPYALLANHIAPYYTLNWLAWELGLAAVVGSELAARLSRRGQVLALGTAAVLVGTIVLGTQPGRERISTWFRTTEARNRRMVDTLLRHRNELTGESTVVVVGVDGLSPWSRSSGSYLRRQIGLPNDWIVLIREENAFFEVTRAAAPIEVRLLSQARDLPGVPCLSFDEAGEGTLARGFLRGACDGRHGPSPKDQTQ